MTTNVLSNDGPSRRPSAGRLGALAALTPIAMYVGWLAIAGWGTTAGQLAWAAVQIVFAAAVAGWILGGRVGRSFPALLGGSAAYGLVAWLVLLPLNVGGSTWGDVQAGRAAGLVEVIGAAVGYLLYGLVVGLYAAVFLLPFGAGWLATFVIFRRIFEP